MDSVLGPRQAPGRRLCNGFVLWDCVAFFPSMFFLPDFFLCNVGDFMNRSRVYLGIKTCGVFLDPLQMLYQDWTALLRNVAGVFPTEKDWRKSNNSRGLLKIFVF